MAAPVLSLPGVQDITSTSARLKVTLTFPPSIPSWAPAAGDTADVSVGGGTLTNNWRAIHDPNGVGYDPFHSRKVTDYSAFFAHQDWREFGGLLIWGGGHSATNYNGVTMLVLAASTIYFECVSAPSTWTNGQLGDITPDLTAYGERSGSSPLGLAAIHSYGSGDMVDGKFVQTMHLAAGYGNVYNAQIAHELDLTDPATGYNARSWVRRVSAYGAWGQFAAPAFTRYVPAQNRIFMMSRGGGPPFALQWFDLATNAWVTGTGTGFNFGSASGFDHGALLYVPSRDLLVGLWRNGSGNLTGEYMNVASGVAQPTLGGSISLSATLAIPTNWGAACWCADNDRILVFGVTGNTDKVYEITIPGTLSSTWTVDSHTLPGGKTIVPPGASGWGKSHDYIAKAKAVVFMPDGIRHGTGGEPTTNDRVVIYRPRGT